MSHDDSLDEETKRLLAEVDSDDSGESKDIKNKGKTWTEKDETGRKVERNDKETPDSEW